MSLSNKITIAGIYAKSGYLGPFFFYVVDFATKVPIA
jgi:hypothetical protein